MYTYKRTDKVEKPEVKQIHLWFGERMHKDKLSVVDVTVCGWVDPPSDQYVHDKSLVTCDSCIRRSK